MNLRIVLISVFSVALLSCAERRWDGRFDGYLSEIGYPSPADSLNLVEMDESVFKQTIPLKGERILVDLVIKPSELEGFVRDGYLFLKHLEQREGEPMLHLLRLPDLEVVASFMKRGNGPGEVLDLRVIPAEDSINYCFLQDLQTDKAYVLDKNLKVHPYQQDLAPKNLKGEDIHIRSCAIHDQADRFILEQWADDGAGLFAMDYSDSTVVGLVNLSCMDDLGRVWDADWTCYVGGTAGDPKKRRLVYYYTYYHRLLFSDYDGKNARVIQFKEQEPFRSKDMWVHMNTGEDQLYYKAAIPSSRYVYLVYKNGFKEDPVPVYLEKWTWDGEPVCRYLLEDGIYPYGGCVDEKDSTLYLLDIRNDDFIYRVRLDEI